MTIGKVPKISADYWHNDDVATAASPSKLAYEVTIPIITIVVATHNLYGEKQS